VLGGTQYPFLFVDIDLTASPKSLRGVGDMTHWQHALRTGGALFLALLTFACSAGAETETVLYNFTNVNNGVNPFGSLVGIDGVLYGTLSGGISYASMVFSLTPPATRGGSWTEAVLHYFTGDNDGSTPNAGLAIGSGGVLYGTTNLGGPANAGTVFSLTPPVSTGGAWTEAVVHNFTGSPSDGGNPNAGVAIGPNGVIVGTTVSGGPSNGGTVFVLTP
jgi:uncharacterized repeat protein (TIGR03803 family)